MKLTTFDYTDAKGKQTSRTLCVLETTEDKYLGIDLGELSDEEIAEFGVAVDKIIARVSDADREKAEVLTLCTEFDVQHKYRQFLISRMTNIVEEDV